MWLSNVTGIIRTWRYLKLYTVMNVVKRIIMQCWMKQPWHRWMNWLTIARLVIFCFVCISVSKEITPRHILIFFFTSLGTLSRGQYQILSTFYIDAYFSCSSNIIAFIFYFIVRHLLQKINLLNSPSLSSVTAIWTTLNTIQQLNNTKQGLNMLTTQCVLIAGSLNLFIYSLVLLNKNSIGAPLLHGT